MISYEYDIICTFHTICMYDMICAVTLYHVILHEVCQCHLRRTRYTTAAVRHTRHCWQMTPKMSWQMTPKMHKSQQHTATSHTNQSSTLIAKFFLTTPASETYINHVKLTVFGVKDCAPIPAEDYPVYADMAKPMKGACSDDALCCKSFLRTSEADINVINFNTSLGSKLAQCHDVPGLVP
jgi:hypothetical protein